MATTLLLLMIPAAYLLPHPLIRLMRNRQHRWFFRPIQLDKRLRRAVKLPDDQPAVMMLRRHASALTQAIIQLDKDIRRPLHLLKDASGEPRVIALARKLMHQSALRHSTILPILLQEGSKLDFRERELLPLCLRAEIAHCLETLLDDVEDDTRHARIGKRLGRRAAVSRHPQRLVNRPLPLSAMDALLTELRRRHADSAAACAEEVLAAMHSSSAAVARLQAQHQANLAQEAERLTRLFRAAQEIDWPALLEQIDPLHSLMSADSVYTAMDASSRLMYRQQASALAQCFHKPEESVIRSALELSRRAHEDALERHIGWYLLDKQGRAALRRSLHARRGAIRLVLERHVFALSRMLLWVSGGFAGWMFLRAGYTLWLAPFFLTLTGCVHRRIIHRVLKPLLPPENLPRMDMTHLQQDMRTLIVLPAVLRSRHEAIRAVRQLAALRQTHRGGGVDCLLLGDWDEAMTQRRGEDVEITHAAASAVEALNQQAMDGARFLYLQRSRVWSGIHHAYTARDGRTGAIETLCRLICRSETRDLMDAATFAPEEIHQRYAWIILVTPDTLLQPDAILHMAGVMAHPLNTRMHTRRGTRGYACLSASMRTRPNSHSTHLQSLLPPDNAQFWMIRPGALLEDTEGWLTPETSPASSLLWPALSGLHTADSIACSTPASTLSAWMQTMHHQVSKAWRTLPWQLSHIKTTSGLLRNPLPSQARFMLREVIREQLIAVCQAVMLLASALMRDPLMLALSLLLPESPAHPARAAVRILLLPLRAWVQLDAAFRAVSRLLLPERRLTHLLLERFQAYETWSQTFMAALLIVLSLLETPWFFSGLALSTAFVCFPLVQARLDSPLSLPYRLTTADEALLQETVASSWRYFEQSTDEETHFLPPEMRQQQPAPWTATTCTPMTIALYLLAMLAACETECLPLPDLTARLRGVTDALEQMQKHRGLFFSRYHLATLEPEGDIPAVDNGWMCAALLTLAQGLRAQLPDMAETDYDLPMRLDALAGKMELSALYDETTGLFFASIDPDADTQDAPYLTLFAHEGLVLSFVAVMRREVPQSQLHRLLRHRIRLRSLRPLLTLHGGAEAILPTLLLPAPCGTLLGDAAQAHAVCQCRHGERGLFGLGTSACHDLTPQLRYAVRPFGMAECAMEETVVQPVFTPWACALLLPFAAQEAINSLRHMRALGMAGRAGMLDAVDLHLPRVPDQAEYALVRSQTASHQAILLCAAANLLTNQALSQHFMTLPCAQSASTLLWTLSPDLDLSAPTLFPSVDAAREPSFRRAAQPLRAPLDAHLIGSAQASVLMGAHGSSVIRLDGQDVTRFTGAAERVEGLQFYLTRGDKCVRLLDPLTPGETFFSEGSVQFVRQCAGVLCRVIVATDPSAHAVLHMVELENPDPLEATIDLTDCLLPAHDGSTQCLGEHRLCLEMKDRCLEHSLATEDTLLQAYPITDAQKFLGRDGDLRHPAGLFAEIPSAPAQHQVCLGFRIRMTVGAHSRKHLTFVTRLMQPDELPYLPGDPAAHLTLSQLHARTIVDSLSLTQDQLASLSTLTGAIMWHGQLHQGTAQTLPSSASSLDLPQGLPLVTLLLRSPDGMALVQETASALEWMLLSGRSVLLCLYGDKEVIASMQPWLHSSMLHQQGLLYTFHDISDDELLALCAVSHLVLHEDNGGAAEQAARMVQRMPVPGWNLPQEEVTLFSDELHFDNGISGFENATGDCLLHLLPHEAPPAPWRNLLRSSRFVTLSDDGGLSASAQHRPVTAFESAYVADEASSTIMSASPAPLSRSLTWDIRISPGLTVWHTRSEDIDWTLTAGCMPRCACGVRTLRLRSFSDRERTLRVFIAASFVLGGCAQEICLTPLPGGVTASHPDEKASAFLMLAEGTPDVRICTPMGYQGLTDIPTMLASDHRGSVAVLSTPVTLAAGGSCAVTWLCGLAAQSDELEWMLRRLQRTGASAVFRSIRQHWRQKTSALVVSTPEESLNLLLNRWLPCQFLPDQRLLTLYGSMLLDPTSTRPALLLAAREELHPLLPWVTSAFIRLSGDESLLNELVPRDDPSTPRQTLYAHCMQALTQSLDAPHLQLMQRMSLQAFQPLMNADDRTDTAAILERHIPITDEPASALLAALACLAQGANTATITLLRDRWHMLFDTQWGLLHAQEDAPQDTLGAVWMLLALCELGWVEDAWSLLRALNPIHHTDDPLRLQDYRSEPYLLSSQLFAQAPHAGQASTTPSAEAAGLLYGVIIRHMLGLHRAGNNIRFTPLLPEDWDSLSLTLPVGKATWHISLGRFDACTVDGQDTSDVTLWDDGRVHQVNIPLRHKILQENT